ncbi:hypothetical protein FNV43_RR10141 [Rhamnella rubrinervis]|uniref:Uncharacterized protein n=1 Tax=Rhamnella rubrinervis TaxID=2594499 RepID=A0A8K0HCN7_9ROSA|nr:hypothetical protein FNV43_RR10141 [Rhamnella rubrinervis]
MFLKKVATPQLGIVKTESPVANSSDSAISSFAEAHSILCGIPRLTEHPYPVKAHLLATLAAVANVWLSIPVQSLHLSGLPRVCLSRSDSLYGVFSSKNSNVCRHRNASLHFNVNHRGDKCIRRVMSENDIVRSVSGFAGGFGFFRRRYIGKSTIHLKRSGVWQEFGILLEEVGFFCDSFGKGSESGGGGFSSFGGGNNDKGKMGEAYSLNVEAGKYCT